MNPIMMKSIRSLFLFIMSVLVQNAWAEDAPLAGDKIPTAQGDLIIHPIKHATFVMRFAGKTIYNDPVGGGGAFEGLPRPDLILVSDIHGDHHNNDTLLAIVTDGIKIVAPQAVAAKLPDKLKRQTHVLANGESVELMGIRIEAVPMYNLTQGRLKFHTQGRGNGYVLTLGGKRVYISGDTEDTREMRALKNIDVAFVCMNLPYTMTVDQAASAIREFRPKIVYPYHYRGSDMAKFNKLIGTDLDIDVRQRDWYRK